MKDGPDSAARLSTRHPNPDASQISTRRAPPLPDDASSVRQVHLSISPPRPSVASYFVDTVSSSKQLSESPAIQTNERVGRCSVNGILFPPKARRFPFAQPPRSLPRPFLHFTLPFGPSGDPLQVSRKISSFCDTPLSFKNLHSSRRAANRPSTLSTAFIGGPPPGLLSTPLIFSSSVALSAGTFPTVSFAAWILAWTHIDHWTMLGEPRSPRLRACLVERDVSFAQVLRVASSSCCSPGHDMLFVDVSG